MEPTAARTSIIIGEVGCLETDAQDIQREFASGERTYDNTPDGDAVRELLRRYIELRKALFRIVWKYQRHADVPRLLRRRGSPA